MAEDAKTIDCVVVGGGPAGLTAAIYLARFHLDCVVLDAGGGRARLIPRTHNHAGFPDGIAGRTLVARMRRQATRFGARIVRAHADAVTATDGGFAVETNAQTFYARAILLATGVTNHAPDIAARDHVRAVRLGLLRYCPICDGFEVTDRRIGVIGTGARGTDEAIFLRGYSRDVTLIAPDRHDLSGAQRTTLARAGIAIADDPAGRLQLSGNGSAILAVNGTLAFDTIYPALGSTIHSDIARSLGATLSDDGCILVDGHQRTTVKGLYAAGDVVRGLDQISHAMGEGGVAATTIRNDLADGTPIYR